MPRTTRTSSSGCAEFFDANADVLVIESYFNEPGTSLNNSIWDPVVMPKASETYRRLW